MNWQCDDIGRLALSGVHDATLARLVLDTEARTVELWLRGMNGERRRLVYGEVEMFHGDAIWEAAVINTIFVWPAADVPDQFLDAPSAGWQPLLQARMPAAADLMAERRRLAMKFSGAYLSSVVCSYGGDLSLLAGSLHIAQWD